MVLDYLKTKTRLLVTHQPQALHSADWVLYVEVLFALLILPFFTEFYGFSWKLVTSSIYFLYVLK